MKFFNRRTWEMELEDWEESLLRWMKWTDVEIQLLRKGSEVLYRSAEELLSHRDKKDSIFWFKLGWDRREEEVK